ncbi:apoptosis-associated speck-like protein containing a CARD isoform X2 [Fundulus heteroclitus]|uniref:apoptosis-associated speck-like protein containing a CARD isoform X2 n=1 Tax=Fundulus heteroclitus TaxID=8078 RepID=UPI00165C550D|nr:apoptosis-associated speck-like protein containing a CARD isoform X2 [Fundulus heteroclitus]
MAPNPKKVLRDILEDLKDADFQKFRVELLERKDGVKTSQVEGKGFLDVADVMVSVYTEKKVLLVADEILREIRCVDAAEELAKAAKKAGFPYQGAASGEGGAPTEAAAVKREGEHFVDRHREKLIQRVTNIAPILDGLLQKKVILQETYDQILRLQTTQSQMREIFICLRASDACKDIFFSILQEKEGFLIKDLI